MSIGPRRAATTPNVPLTLAEKHLLSVLDGELAADELALICGVSSLELQETVERLVLLGAIAPAAPNLTKQPATTDEARSIALPKTALPLIDALFAALDHTDYYTLLGVAFDGDKNDVKRAYYRLAPAFHPDKHYSKHLGPYKARMEAVFTHLTRAHDTLRYHQRRTLYDSELGGEERVRFSPAGKSAHAAADAILSRPAMSQLRDQASSSQARTSGPPASDSSHRTSSNPPISRPSRPHPSSRGRMAVARTSALPPDSVPSARPSRPQPDPAKSPEAIHAERRSSPNMPRQPSTPRMPAALRSDAHAGRPSGAHPSPSGHRSSMGDRARREALRRKLGRRSVNPPRSSAETSYPVPRSTVPRSTVPRSAAEVLRNNFDDAAKHLKQRRLQRYLTLGKEALKTGDVRAAAAAFRQALKLDPDDRETKELAAQTAVMLKR